MDIIFDGRDQALVTLISKLIFACIVHCFQIRWSYNYRRMADPTEEEVFTENFIEMSMGVVEWWWLTLCDLLLWIVTWVFKVSVICALISLIIRVGHSSYQLFRKWWKQRNSFTPLKYLTIISGIAHRMRREQLAKFQYQAQSPVFDRDDYKRYLSRSIRSLIKRCDRTVLPPNRKAMLKRAIVGLVRKQEQWATFVVEKLRLPLECAHQHDIWTKHHTLDTTEIASSWFEELDAAAKFRIACTFYMDEQAAAFYEQLSERQRHELLAGIGIDVEQVIDADAVIGRVRATPEWWHQWYASFCNSNDLLDDAWRGTSDDIHGLASGLSEGNSPKVEHSWRHLKPSQKPTVLRHLSKMVRVTSEHNGGVAYASNDAIYAFLTVTLSEDEQKEVVHFLCGSDDDVDDAAELIDLNFFSGLFCNWPHQEYAVNFFKQAKINEKLFRKILNGAVGILREQQEDSMLNESESMCGWLSRFATDLRPDLDRELKDAREEFGFRARHVPRQWVEDILFG